MRKAQRKAQGALEFLMTYGWAFLVILIMIGALAYFGILNPSKLLPDRCLFGTQITCKEGEYAMVKAPADANTISVRINLLNNIGNNVIVHNATITTDGATLTCAIIDFTTAAGAANIASAVSSVWTSGEKATLAATCTGATAIVPGTKTKALIEFKWYPVTADTSFSHSVDGEVYATVQ